MAKVINPFDGTERRAHKGDRVYVVSRNGQYKHTAHVIRRINEQGHAVTKCTIWIRDYAVYSQDEDCFIWCENGCKPAPNLEALAEINERIASLSGSK
jgi:anaerobic selenocysteine-containing dehydrogenase